MHQKIVPSPTLEPEQDNIHHSYGSHCPYRETRANVHSNPPFKVPYTRNNKDWAIGFYPIDTYHTPDVHQNKKNGYPGGDACSQFPATQHICPPPLIQPIHIQPHPFNNPIPSAIPVATSIALPSCPSTSSGSFCPHSPVNHQHISTMCTSTCVQRPCLPPKPPPPPEPIAPPKSTMSDLTHDRSASYLPPAT